MKIRLGGLIPDELWTTKPTEFQEDLRRARAEMERYEQASEAYEATGLQILELAQTAYSSYVCEESARTGATRQDRRIELHV